MTKTNLPADDVHLLNGTAELFLWLGWDRAADFIYAALEAQGAAAGDITAGAWAEVFAAG